MQCRLLTSAAAVVSAVAAAMTSWPQEEASASMCSWISRTIRIRFSVCKVERVENLIRLIAIETQINAYTVWGHLVGYLGFNHF